MGVSRHPTTINRKGPQRDMDPRQKGKSDRIYHFEGLVVDNRSLVVNFLAILVSIPPLVAPGQIGDCQVRAPRFPERSWEGCGSALRCHKRDGGEFVTSAHCFGHGKLPIIKKKNLSFDQTTRTRRADTTGKSLTSRPSLSPGRVTAGPPGRLL
ncbi:hypothetical protein EVAR_81734_1 [Eumeta japonica]|uniref:Uncharacterized protein n=1 Tax=Eumeta variegata TaxID=151549 RepID=A0A4C1UH97_EUMVA|nr:hypothetical protein EVAR_81734_1 [Eumeta japonica]